MAFISTPFAKVSAKRVRMSDPTTADSNDVRTSTECGVRQSTTQKPPQTSDGKEGFKILPLPEFTPDYSSYQHLKIEKLKGEDRGICVVTFNRPEKFNACNIRMHWECANIWKDIDRDNQINVVILTGAGKAFCAGGDLQMVEQMAVDLNTLTFLHKDARDLVHNMVNCEKIIIASVNGVAIGAGMAMAMMADITIVSEEAKFNDGHTRLGVAAGDHAAAILPLLMGMQKTKYYVLTGEFITAKEADEMKMVSLVVPPTDLARTTLEVARKINNGPQNAIKYSKRALNQWIRHNNLIAFDLSCAYEMLGFRDVDVSEGVAAVKQKRKPNFASKL